MGTTDNLKNIINSQKETLAALETEYQVLANSDLAKENARLKAELEKLRLDFAQASSKATVLADEQARLKNALYEQIYNEKIKLINITTQRLDLYFRSGIAGELNKLTALESSVKTRINSIREALTKNNIDLQDNLYAQLDELTALLNSKVTEAQANAARLSSPFSPQELDKLEALKSEQISDEQIRAVAQKNNLERFVGLNVLNAVGVFLLIIGVITVARYTYANSLLPDLLKGIIMFAFGGVLLITGEILNRKKPDIFSLGLSAGGVAILYVALATSYFGLHILAMYPAIILCVLIAAGAFILSNRYNSQTIAAFALIGGYLPIFSIGYGAGADNSNTAMTYGIMIYFVGLNLLALLISFSKKWHVSAFIGLFLNIISAMYICTWFFDSIRLFHGANDIFAKAFTILYVTFAFLIYTSIPIISTYRTRAKFGKPDIVLLAINTVFSSLLMYVVFYSFNLQNYNGLLAVFFAVIYLLLGRFIERKFTGEELHAKALFYLTGLAFVVLIIPLQFGLTWLSLGWLAEGVFLAAYGILNNEKRFQQVGFGISLLCLCAFVLYDCTLWQHYLFAYKYLAITMGSLIILGAYMHKKVMAGQFVKIYKYFALANVWVYTMYIIHKLGHVLLAVYSNQTAYNIPYLSAAAAVAATFFIAYVIPRIKLLADPGAKVLSMAIYMIGLLGLFWLNTVNKPISINYLLTTTKPAFAVTSVGVAILVFLGLLSVLALRDLMQIIVTGRKLSVEWYPLLISGYFVVILTQNLITQFNLSFASAVISIIYVLAALAWIIFGFARRYLFIRRFGLGLALLAVAKLFLIDLSNLTQGYKIVSYFTLGITLLAISFVYQHFSKQLELKGVVSAGLEKDH